MQVSKYEFPECWKNVWSGKAQLDVTVKRLVAEGGWESLKR